MKHPRIPNYRNIMKYLCFVQVVVCSIIHSLPVNWSLASNRTFSFERSNAETR